MISFPVFLFQFIYCYILERKDKKWFKRDIIVLISFLILFVSISSLVNIEKEMSLPGFRKKVPTYASESHTKHRKVSAVVVKTKSFAVRFVPIAFWQSRLVSGVKLRTLYDIVICKINGNTISVIISLILSILGHKFVINHKLSKFSVIYQCLMRFYGSLIFSFIGMIHLRLIQKKV